MHIGWVIQVPEEVSYFSHVVEVAHNDLTAGPWVGADFESGMYFGGGNQTKINLNNTPLTSDFVSLHLKGRTDGFALKGGDATQGRFKTMYDGARPIKGVSNPNDCHWCYLYMNRI